jgi:hypothetical protein
MITPVRRRGRLIVVAILASGWAATAASAQTPDQQSITTPSLAAAKARVPVGGIVYVTDTTGATIKGKLAALTDEAVEVNARAGVRSVAAAEIRRIEWQQPDSPLTGVLIGAAIGAVPGVYWLIADPNECTGLCPEEYGFIAVGALLGGVIDHVITRKVTVYSAGAATGREKNVTIAPLLTRDRKGVRIAVKF